jgi:hypothetical protein
LWVFAFALFGIVGYAEWRGQYMKEPKVMRSKLFTVVMVAAFAVMAVQAASSMAALPEFTPTANTLTGTGTAGTLSTLGNPFSITCKNNTVSGSVTGAKAAEYEITFKECEVLGGSAKSLGGTAGTIKTGKLKGELCYINEAKKEVGLYTTVTLQHIEAPLGILINISGTIIAQVEPVNKSQTTGTITLASNGTNGDPKWTTCGGKTASLLASQDTKHEENKTSAMAQVFSVTFTKAEEILA